MIRICAGSYCNIFLVSNQSFSIGRKISLIFQFLIFLSLYNHKKEKHKGILLKHHYNPQFNEQILYVFMCKILLNPEEVVIFDIISFIDTLITFN